MSRIRFILTIVGLLVLLAPLVIMPLSVQATFPGENGLIVFHSSRDGNYQIYVMNADGSGQTRLTNNAATDFAPAWSPDGTKIAFQSNRDGNNQIYVMNADGSDQTRLTNNADDDSSPAWSPDGAKIAFTRITGPRAGDIYVINADGSGQVKLTNNVAGNFPFYYSPAWSPDGTKIALLVALSDSNQEIYIMNPDGSGLTALTSNGVFTYSVDWSPDGTKIAFSGGSPGTAAVYVMNADGSSQTNITTITDADAVWSPDGARIAFTSARDGNGEVYIMNADGSGQVRLTSNLAEDGGATWQPLRIGCYIDAPSSVNENDPFTATVTCNSVSGVYGFEYDLNIDPSSPTLSPQASAFTAGTIFDSMSTLTLINNLTDGFAVSLQSPETAVSGDVTLGSIGYDTDDPGTALLTLDALLLGDINGQEIPDSLAANPDATITIVDLLLASFEGEAKREAGADLTADITVLADGEVPDTTGTAGGYFTFSYAEETVATDATLEVSAPGHLGCVTPDLGLPDDAHTVLTPITLLAGDVNGDGDINLTDASIIVSARFGDPVDPGHMPDLDEDGRISILDLIHVGRNYGATVPACQ